MSEELFAQVLMQIYNKNLLSLFQQEIYIVLKIVEIMAGDLARTLAGNISNSQMNTTVSTPLFQQSSE
jgi:hypothetical protein